MMRSLRALWRIAKVFFFIAQGLWIQRTQFKKINASQKYNHVKTWSQRMLGAMGIEVKVKGQPPLQGPMLIVSNHISWLDILVIHASGFCRFVSKAEIKHWPVLGALADDAGTLFIERESRRDALRVVHHMAQALQAGDVLAVFPEGTTGDGIHILPFHANLLQAAIAVHAPIQPVALKFLDQQTGDVSLAPTYIGEETLLTSVWRTLCAPPLQVIVRYGQPQSGEGLERRAWAEHLQQQVVQLYVSSNP
jgi:1-acyl-sn-glycerol-3-phosphate acyltransferase